MVVLHEFFDLESDAFQDVPGEFYDQLLITF